MENNRKVWVIGHKNPDTDSICSAICYANLKNKLEGEHFEARRAGKPNPETEFVLNYFGVEAPDPVFDLGTQVMDVDYRIMDGVAPEVSMKKAWERMAEVGVETVPVLKKKKLVGILNLKDIANTNMDLDPRILGKANTSVKNILETIDGKLVVGDSKSECPSGKVLIAASNPEVMEDYVEEGDIVLVGNRYEVQLCALEMKAGMIIACCGAVVSATIKKLAEEKGCMVISTKHETYSVARLITMSMPVEHYMTAEGLVTFYPDTPMEEVRETMAKLRHRYFPIIDHAGMYKGMLSRRNLLGMKSKQVIMVDHNEKNQACDGIEQAEVLEIIDHHRLGTMETITPIFFRNQPVGCTATIIYQMYMEEKVPIDKITAGLLCSAIISDTLLFRSPTCTGYDRAAAEKLAKLAQINLEKYANEMFAAGADFASRTAEQIFHQDFKEFGIGEYRVGVGQIMAMSSHGLDEIREKMKKYLPTALKKHSDNMLFFVMTSIFEEKSEIICIGNGSEELSRAAFGEMNENGSTVVEGLVSRKKQMIPALTRALSE